MNSTNEISIIGGGLAGLTAAIDLLNRNFNVVVFEKNEYPKHKVCGEFISNEVLPYLENLGLNIDSLQQQRFIKPNYQHILVRKLKQNYLWVALG